MPRVFISLPRDIQAIIDRVIVREGGFVNHPDDPGKATNMGITIKTLSDWRFKDVIEEDVKNLSKSEAAQIYFQNYWKPLKLNHLGNNWWVKEFLFDWCVNGGLKNPVRQVQRFVNVKADGIMGPNTAAAITNWFLLTGANAHSRMVDLRIWWYIRLAKRKHSHIVFVEGWFNRANDFRYEAPPFKVTVV